MGEEVGEGLPGDVTLDMLKWDNEGMIPTAVTGRGPKRAWARALEYHTREDLRRLLEEERLVGGRPVDSIMVDCDGDALYYEYPIDGNPKHVTHFTEKIKDVRDVDATVYRKRHCQELIRTVITTKGGIPLGIEYSNRQSLIDSMKPKRLIVPPGRIVPPAKYLTLMRNGNRWPKGLKVPEGLEPDDPLPEVLEPSSGIYVAFDSAFYSPRCKALLMVATVPRGHWFCHEGYKGCFNRYLVLEEWETEEEVE